MSSILCTVFVVIYRLFYVCSHTVVSNREAASTLLVTVAFACCRVWAVYVTVTAAAPLVHQL